MQRSKLKLRYLAVCLIVSSGILAAGEIKYEEVLPETARIAVWTSDFESMIASGLSKKLLDDPRVKSVHDQLLESLTPLKDHIAPNWDARYERLKKICSGNIAFALLFPEGVEDPVPVLFFQSSKLASLQELMTEIVTAVNKDGTVSAVTIGNRSGFQITMKDEVEAVYFLSLDNNVVIGLVDVLGEKDKFVNSVLTELSKGPRLKDSTIYQSCIKRVGQPGLMFGYLDVQSMINLAMSDLGESEEDLEQAKKVMKILGVDGIKGIAMNIVATDEGYLTNAFIDCPAPRTGLWEIIEPTNGDGLEAMAHIPADANLTDAFTTPFHFEKIWPLAEAIALSTGGEDALGGLREFRKSAPQQMMGMDPFVLLDGLDGPAVFALNTPEFLKSYSEIIAFAMKQAQQNQPAPELVGAEALKWPMIASIGVTDHAKVSTLVNGLMGFAMMATMGEGVPVSIQSEMPSGAVMWMIGAKQDEFKRFGSFCLMLTNKHLVISGDAALSRQVAALDAGESGPSLATDERFIQALKTVKQDNLPVAVDVMMTSEVNNAQFNVLDTSVDMYMDMLKDLKDEIAQEKLPADDPALIVLDALIGVDINKLFEEKTFQLVEEYVEKNMDALTDPGYAAAMSEYMPDSAAKVFGASDGLVMNANGGSMMIHRGSVLPAAYVSVIAAIAVPNLMMARTNANQTSAKAACGTIMTEVFTAQTSLGRLPMLEDLDDYLDAALYSALQGEEPYKGYYFKFYTTRADGEVDVTTRAVCAYPADGNKGFLMYYRTNEAGTTWTADPGVTQPPESLIYGIEIEETGEWWTDY